jgi:tRNA A-37 threonylcarbamoyl transferase component Bud32
MERLNSLLLEWEARRHSGDPVGVDVLCPDDPALREELSRTISFIESIEAMSRSVLSVSEQLPNRFGKYQIRRVLGEGGMGIVYEAWDEDLSRKVAIKVIKPKLSRYSSRRAMKRFQHESKILAKFRRKSIVEAFEAGEQDGVHYLVMDYLPGGNLADCREQLHQEGTQSIVALMEKVSRAVQDAHDEDVLHRDLKPANVLLDEKGNPFIADFGLAELLEADSEGLKLPETVTIIGVGTLPYMAPEQFDYSFGNLSKATDVWALGVIFYELLANHRPFINTKDLGYRELITRYRPAPLSGMPKALTTVVARCLEKRPEARFQSAGDLADALQRLYLPTRRRVLVAGLSAGVFATGAGLWWGRADPEFEDYSDPKSVQRALRRLERGERVTLIGDGQPVPGYRLAIGPASGNVLRGPEYSFGVQTNGDCLVELLPRLPPGEWRIEARIEHAHRDFGKGSCVGVATGITRVRGPNGWIAQSHLLYISFDAAERGIGVVRSSPHVLFVREPGPLPFDECGADIVFPKPIPPEPGNAPALRGMEVLVSENLISSRVGQISLPDLSFTRFVSDRDDVLEIHPVHKGSVVPETKFLGGVGVFARFGVLRVESLTVSPRE